MSAVAVSVLVAVIGVLASLAGSFFIAGWRWGSINKDVEYIKRDVAEIKSLFRLTFINQDNKKG